VADPEMSVERAATLLAGATGGTWEISVMRDGVQVGEELAITVLDDPRAHEKPDGTWHAVIIARGLDGPTRQANGALLAAAPELARAYIVAAGYESSLREQLATAERERDEAKRRAERFMRANEALLAAEGEQASAFDKFVKTEELSGPGADAARKKLLDAEHAAALAGLEYRFSEAELREVHGG
jgi:hypothetical protein